MNLDTLLRTMVSKGASDLHLKVDCFPHLRINGELVPLADQGKLDKEDSLMMAFSIMNSKQKERFRNAAEVDIGYGVRGLGRFRINVFQQRGNVSIAVRAVPTRILSFDELFLPPVLRTIAEERRGLVLVTGTTGSGKSTTIASMLNYINENFTRHIITIEDPIEFSYNDRLSLISQREIGVDATSFAAALRSSLRQDPDTILVGEMRDAETIETALVAAETGHMVFSTLHTLDAVETINRITTAFPVHQHRQIRLQLSMVLRAIVSMRLMRRSDIPGRIPAIEILRTTELIRSYIVDADKTRLIREALAAGTSQYGMQTFDQSIYDHYSAGRISLEDAFAYSTNPEEFKLRIQGIYTTKDAAIESMQNELTR
ncbi:MAG: type IV pilus twitching motility protein PilT [Acidobacteriota bacterium]|jgi:twitching motility protein PilT|nr:type IV pilus twitching motility protein PilT [Acidobacteriota bacterium]NLT33957.1 type IV pilus twitching motility protein PilT [Acidobacteriota bacterium]